jgi:HlyD family secretion protein
MVRCSKAALAVALLCGCGRIESKSMDLSDVESLDGYRQVSLVDSKKPNQVLAQGRIQPARGVVRISAIPGDRIEEILVQPGQPIRKDQLLVVMQSHQLKTLELESALLRLEEAHSMRLIKQQEADLAIDAATLKVQSAGQVLTQALSQQTLARKSINQISSLEKQIAGLQELRDTPLTRAAIGTIELESKRNELLRISLMNEQAILTANMAAELAELQVAQSQKGLVAANKARSLVDRSTPIASLEKQIELLKVQVEQANLASPIDGVVVSINGEVGERAGPIPLVELADLTSIVCVAEVHESDVALIAINDSVELRSSALLKSLSGRVQRIDRVVGAVQLRSPNPMARADFRAIPVWILIDPNDTQAAAQRLQLQVEVSIATTR